MPMIKINNANYYYELHGSGEPLVLIEGYGCDHVFWVPILGRLADQYQVLIFDNRACGQTTDDGEELSVEMMAEEVMALCSALKLHRPHIVGHSLGGAIAQTIGAQYAGKINKLALLSTTYAWRTPMAFAFRSLLQMRKDNVDFDLIFRTAIPWLLGDRFLEDEKKVGLFKKAILENPYAQSLENQARQFAAIEDFYNEEQLSKITAETLVIYGEQDIAVLPREAFAMSERITRSNVKGLDCAHVLPAEMPQELAALLLDFLR